MLKMKFVLLSTIFVAISFTCFSQRYALLSKDFKQPITYTDSVTVEQVNGFFPVEAAKLDSFSASLIFTSDLLNKRQRSKMTSFDMLAGNTIISTSRAPMAYGDRFNVLAKTNAGHIKAVYNITTADNSNAKNAKRVDKIISYIKKNRSLFTIPYEIHPKFYNVVVVTE